MQAGLANLLINIASSGSRRPLSLEVWAVIAIIIAAIAWMVVPL